MRTTYKDLSEEKKAQKRAFSLQRYHANPAYSAANRKHWRETHAEQDRQRCRDWYNLKRRKVRPVLQQTCKVCRRPDKFNFHVPDEVWAAIVPPEFQHRAVCLGCFDQYAHRKGINYAQSLSLLCFAGRRASFSFEIVTAVEIVEVLDA